jgi:two-component system cell cycle sensor histidine kinase/response regulator CckA
MLDDATARALALASYQILDSPAEDGFDDLVLLAAHIADAPIAVVSFLDVDRVWFKAVLGGGVR